MLQYGENINILGYLCSVLCGCVGPSWLMAMLWTRHASGTQLGPSYLQGGQQTFLPYFSKKHLGTQKNKIYYSQTLKGIWHVQVRSSGEGREVREGGFGILPLLASKSEVSGISWGYSLLTNWKHNSRNEGKRLWRKVIQAVSYLGYQGFSEWKTSWVWWPSSLSDFASTCVTQLAICLFKIEVFWDGSISNQKLDVRHSH